MPRKHRPGSSLPEGRNYQGNRFAALMGKAKGKKKGSKRPPPFAKGKKPKVPPAAQGLAMAMRRVPFADKA